MAITQIGAAESDSNSAGSTSGNLSVSVPAGVANGDVLIACVYKALDDVHTLTAPGGWTQIGSNANASANIQSSVWRRTASSEPASYTWNISASGIWGVTQVAFRGVDTVAPVNTSASANGTTTDPYSCPNLTLTATSRVLSFGASRDDSTTEVTHTATDTELADWGFDGGASTRNGAIYLSAEHASGSYTGLSINPSGSITNYTAWSVALKVLTPTTGDWASTLPSMTSVFAATREIPAGTITSSLPSAVADFAGSAAPPEGSMATTLPSVTSTFAGNSIGGDIGATLPSMTSTFDGGIIHGAINSTLPSISSDWAAAVNPIGGFTATLPFLTDVVFVMETRPFGEHVIQVEDEKRAFRITADDMVPIYRSQVTDQ
jgi:hypothetical protein